MAGLHEAARLVADYSTSVIFQTGRDLLNANIID